MAPPFNVRPKKGDQEGATPLSADYSSTIDQMVKQFANRSRGENVPRISKGFDVPTGTIPKILHELNKLSVGRDEVAEKVTLSTVTNPRHMLAGVAQKFFPKMYRQADKSPIKFTFKQHGMSDPAVGKVRRNPEVTEADISIRQDAMDVLGDILHPDSEAAKRAIQFYLKHDPHALNEAITALPHELGHVVRYRIAASGKADAYMRSQRGQIYEQGMPTAKRVQFRQDQPQIRRGRVENRIEQVLRTGKGDARIDPHVAQFAKKGGYGAQRADEALIQQAAQNQMRNSGVIPKELARSLEEILNRRAQ